MIQIDKTVDRTWAVTTKALANTTTIVYNNCIMYVAEIEAVQSVLPLYQNNNEQARTQALAELAVSGIEFDTQIDRLQARQRELDDQSDQASLNSQFLTSFRLLLPQPVEGLMVARDDDELERISRNVIWDNASPSYLIGRLNRTRMKRFGKMLLDHTTSHPGGTKGIGVVLLRNRDVDTFLRGEVFTDELTDRDAESMFDPVSQNYHLRSNSVRSVRLGPSLLSRFDRRTIRENNQLSFDTQSQYIYGAKAGSMPDTDMREYEVMHHIAKLAANFGIIDGLDNLLDERKETALLA